MINVEELTVKQIRNMLQSGELSSYELVLSYQKRIAEIDKSGPTINSVIELNPDAVHIAEAMDRERKKGKTRSAMHGIPVLIKDNINTNDLMRTRAGSIALRDNFAPYDATITKKMRQAGMIILGKTNMTELANYMSYTMKNGHSSAGGQVINPYNKEGDVWGSSSGSAVAMAASLATVAVGTETDGSIIWPSHLNSIVGIKPTRGLVSRHGILPICTGQDIAGPMARTVADAAELLNILVGEDENDPSTWCLDLPMDYTDYFDLNGLKGLKIGINRGYESEFVKGQSEIAERAYKDLQACGAELIEGIKLNHLKSDSCVLLYEFKMCLNKYLSTNPSTKCRTLNDMIDYYADNKEIGLKYGMSILLDAELKTSGNCTDPEYILGKMKSHEEAKQALNKIFDSSDLDILVCPGITDCSPISGYPSIIVPAGYDDDNMPFGITFVGKPFSEPLLIKAAYAFEQATKHRKPPTYN